MSNASSSCRIDWRPSRLLCATLAGLGALAAISVALSDMSAWGKPPVALAALGYGLWLARREWRRPDCVLEFDAVGNLVMHVRGTACPVLSPQLSLRGLVASLSWRDEVGARRTLAWCADTLPVSSRRALRLRVGQAACA